MPAGDILAGLVLFAVMLAGVAAGTSMLLARRFPGPTGAARAVAWSMIATAGITAVHLLPLALGIMSRGSVIVTTLLWLAACWAVPAVAGERDRRREPLAPSPLPLIALAALAVAGVAVFGLAELKTVLYTATGRIDALNFHFPGIGAWMHTGSLWQIDVYLSDLAPGHYPNTGDVLLLATMLPWKSDWVAHLAMYPYWALTGLTVYALAQELRAPTAVAALMACAVMALPTVSTAALAGGLVDTLALACFTAGLLFLARHARNGRTAELVLAGISLGLAFGTKWYMVSSVAVVVIVWALARLRAGRGLSTVIRQTAAVTGLVVGAGGIWLVRNLVESSNPFFPVKVEVGGTVIFDAPDDFVREAAGFTILDYVKDFDWEIWDVFIIPQLRDALAAPVVAIALAAAGAVVALLLRRREGAGVAWVGLAMGLILLAVYTVTPYTAGGPEGQPVLVAADVRYAVPAILVFAAIGAWATGLWRRGPVVASAVLFLATLEGLNASRKLIATGLGKKDVLVALAVVAGLALVAVALVPALVRLQGAAERRALAVIALVAVAVVAAGSIRVADRYQDNRYRGGDEVVDTILDRFPEDQRVGLAGVWTDDGLPPPLPAYGPRYDNEVFYVGRNDKDVFRRFETAEGFARAVEAGGYDLLVVGRGRPPAEPGDLAPEERWAKAAGYSRVVASERLSLWRAPGT